MATLADVKSEVGALVIKAFGDRAKNVHFNVRENQSRNYHRGGTGIYTIEFWSLKRYIATRLADRAHIFRTKKGGEIPADKIAAFLNKRRIELEQDAQRAAERKSFKEANTPIADRVRVAAKAALPHRYISDYQSTASIYVAPYEYEANKVDVSIGAMRLTEAQATALFDLVATFK
jgi:hypothetical protein